jgi:hypothetical protein
VYEKYTKKKYRRVSKFVEAEVQKRFSLTMYLTGEWPTSLGMLPDELLLVIARNVPNIWNLALTNKAFFQICADVLVDQANTSASFSEVCRAIRCMTEPDYLIGKFLTRVSTRVIEDIHNSKFPRAERVLEIIERLPPNTRVPDNFFLSVVEKGRDFILQAIDDSEFYDAQKGLGVIHRFTYISDMLSENNEADVLA